MRFLLFAGSDFYPSGGWDDFVCSYETLEQAMDHDMHRESCWDWAHVVDLEFRVIVATWSRWKMEKNLCPGGWSYL